jgi:hypothetical protein
VLIGVERGAINSAIPVDPFGDRVLQLGDQHLGLAPGAVEEFGKVGEDKAHGAIIGEACIARRRAALLHART